GSCWGGLTKWAAELATWLTAVAAYPSPPNAASETTNTAENAPARPSRSFAERGVGRLETSAEIESTTCCRGVGRPSRRRRSSVSRDFQMALISLVPPERPKPLRRRELRTELLELG